MSASGFRSNHSFAPSGRTRSPTAASFLTKNQNWDRPRSFLDAVREKYMSDNDAFHSDAVYFSGKEAEEIGFQKFAQRQKQLQGIHVLVLDGMRIRHRRSDEGLEFVPRLCAEITDLDLSGNLFTSLDEVLDLCSRLPNLRSLTLDRNRFDVGSNKFPTLPNVRSLGISSCLVEEDDLSIITSCFPCLQNLLLADNEFSTILSLNLPPTLTSLDLSGNSISTLSDIKTNPTPHQLHTIVLKRNDISSVGHPVSFAHTAQDLDLSHNSASSWAFINDIHSTFPDLKHLRVTGNPLYRNLLSADGAPLAPEDGYMLTVARVPGLETLNHSRITAKERLNSEAYYLSQIALELSTTNTTHQQTAAAAAAAGVLSHHPLYRLLCEEYGEPVVAAPKNPQLDNTNTLAARLVKLTLTPTPTLSSSARQRCAPAPPEEAWAVDVPRSFSIYSLLGCVAARLDLGRGHLNPLDLRLVLETGEEDPGAGDLGCVEPEWWDSDDEEEKGGGRNARAWVTREVELLAGTRSLGSYIDGPEAKVRVEIREKGF